VCATLEPPTSNRVTAFLGAPTLLHTSCGAGRRLQVLKTRSPPLVETPLSGD
jgi:hypothetical protein